MKRFVLPLIAAIALPTAVNAESHWLILHYSHAQRSSFEKVEMDSATACEKEGRRWENSSTHGTKSTARRFHCVVGK